MDVLAAAMLPQLQGSAARCRGNYMAPNIVSLCVAELFIGVHYWSSLPLLSSPSPQFLNEVSLIQPFTPCPSQRAFQVLRSREPKLYLSQDKFTPDAQSDTLQRQALIPMRYSVFSQSFLGGKVFITESAPCSCMYGCETWGAVGQPSTIAPQKRLLCASESEGRAETEVYSPTTTSSDSSLSIFKVHRSSKVEISPGAQQKRNACSSRECIYFGFATNSSFS